MFLFISLLKVASTIRDVKTLGKGVHFDGDIPVSPRLNAINSRGVLNRKDPWILAGMCYQQFQGYTVDYHFNGRLDL